MGSRMLWAIKFILCIVGRGFTPAVLFCVNLFGGTKAPPYEVAERLAKASPLGEAPSKTVVRGSCHKTALL